MKTKTMLIILAVVAIGYYLYRRSQIVKYGGGQGNAQQDANALVMAKAFG